MSAVEGNTSTHDMVEVWSEIISGVLDGFINSFLLSHEHLFIESTK